MTRSQDMQSFIAASGRDHATITPLAQDASARQYFRVQQGAETTILMDAPPDKNPPQDSFVNIAQWLTTAGFSAPEILHSDIPAGFLLCEDLSDAVFSTEIDSGRLPNDVAFEAASDMLRRLHQCTPMPDLPIYTPNNMSRMAQPLFDFYQPDVSRDPQAESQFYTALETVLQKTWLGNPVTLLRDFHAGNLIWLPNREAHKRVGLLDFQDAAVGHVAYDLVSMLFDIRRKIDMDLAQDTIAKFAQKSNLPVTEFQAACAAQSAQRNLRILGIFSALASRQGKTGYLKWLPAVWNQLQRDLAHPALSDLQDIASNIIVSPENSKAAS